MSMIEELVRKQGFDCIGECDPKQLRVQEEVRDACAEDKCHAYNKNWACPPACGDIYSYQDQMHAYSHGLVVQTVAQLEDAFDVETMMEASDVQKGRFAALRDDIAEAGLADRVMMLSSGHCTVCPTCTYPDDPCRFPERRMVSMEAAGLVVSNVCRMADIPYNHGPNTIAYVSCILFD